MATKKRQMQARLVSILQDHQHTLELAKPLPWHTQHRRLLRGVTISALLAVFVSVSACILVTQYSLTRVTLAGIPVTSRMKTATLQKQVEDKVAGYKTEIATTDNNKQSYPLSEMGLSVDAAASADQALQTKNPANLLKRLIWWRHQNVTLQVNVDKVVLQNFLETHATQVSTAAQNAGISINDGQVVVTPEKPGDGYTLPQGTLAIVESVSNLQKSPLILQKQQLKPNITSTQAEQSAVKIKALLAQSVSFTINGKTITPSPVDMGSWLDITPNEANHTIDYSVNSGKVLYYMNYIAKPYVQPPITQITMKDSEGKDVILVRGQNGVDVTNKETTASEVAQQVMAGKKVAIDLPVKFANFKSIAAQPHDKWIVVDISTKRMYAYEQTNLVRSFLISAGAPKTPTVLGEYHIYSKVAVQDMRGANVDGSQYFQPHVHWINYFYADYAIHGNYWRPTSYFGNVNSSHGCVGITDTDALWIYNWAPVGTTVIVHN